MVGPKLQEKKKTVKSMLLPPIVKKKSWMDRNMLLPTLAVLVLPCWKPELQKVLCIIQKKMEQNEDGRQIFLGLFQKMTALQTKFYDVTLPCDDILTIQTHKVKLCISALCLESF